MEPALGMVAPRCHVDPVQVTSMGGMWLRWEVCRQGMPPGVVTPIEANLLCSCVEKVSEGSSSFSTRPEAEVEISIML